KLVARIEQLEQESLDGRSRVDEALPEHAVAHVEQHRKADGHPLVGELGDDLAFALLENLERLGWQFGDEVPVLIDDRRGHADEIDTRLESGGTILGDEGG